VGTPAPGSSSAVSIGVYDLRYDDLDGIWHEAEERASLLRAAWALGTPRQLPSCVWWAHNCEYRTGRVCTCTGTEPDGRFAIADTVRDLVPNPAAVEEVRRALARAAPENNNGRVVHRFRDLMFPRLAYFRRLHADSDDEESRPARSEAELRWWREKRWWRDRLAEAMEAAAPGSLSVGVSADGGPDEPVHCHDGAPYLVRISHGHPILDPRRLLAERPQYFLELGLRAAAVGATVGRLILAFPQAPRLEHRVLVFEAEFDPVERFARLALERRDALALAVATRDPSALAPCYDWMFDGCAYRSECGG
jgi:hypothetical protein